MKDIKGLFQVLDRWKWHYFFAAFLLMLSSFVRMAEPKVLQIVVDGIVGHASDESNKKDIIVTFFYSLLPDINSGSLLWALFGAGILFAVIAMVQASTSFFASILSASSTEKAIKKLRDKLFTHIQGLPLSKIDDIPRGEMIQRCTGDVDTVRNFIGTQIIELLRLSAVFIGAFYMMSLVHFHYALISIAMFLPILLSTYFFFVKEQKVWKEHEAEQDKLTAIIQENLAGIRVVQAFAQQEKEIARFDAQNEQKRRIGIKQINLHTFFWPLSDILVHSQITLSVVAGAFYVLSQEISLGEYASFFTYSLMVTWPMRSIGRIVSQLGMATVAMQRMRQILDMLQEDYGNPLEQAEASLKGDIEFRNVSFAYPTDKKEGKVERWALDNVSFKIEAGQCLAILGPTGSGKSTIVSLLARFYEPDKGQIFLDGKPLSDYPKTFLRSRLGIVPQKAFLFSTTVRDNITYALAGREVEAAELEAAMEDAAVTDFIHKLADGLDTIVGERGVTLSGGQKQRVTLARTLLSNPDMLILDDASSAVDTETEYAIQQALLRRMEGKTAILIAHRLTSIQHAQRILVFEKGKLIEEGTPAELLKKGGFYKQVYNIQVGLELDISDISS